jgi:predicted RNA-binding protein with TRAM domain
MTYFACIARLLTNRETLIEVPSQEIQVGDVTQDGVYRVALTAPPTGEADFTEKSSESEQQLRRERQSEPTPPVDEGDIREVEIEGLGGQGDGVGKIDRGYVMKVSGTEPGDKVTAEMQAVKQNFAIGEVIRRSDRRGRTRERLCPNVPEWELYKPPSSVGGYPYLHSVTLLRYCMPPSLIHNLFGSGQISGSIRASIEIYAH